MAIERPPRDITPDAFFRDWLPAQYRAAAATTGTPPDTTVVVELTGEGGGQWTVETHGGELTVRPGRAEQADLVLSLSVDDWRAALCGEDGAADLLPQQVDPAKLLVAADPQTRQLLEATAGTLTFEIPGFNGRTWSIAVSLKGSAEPAATITIDADTLAQIRSGELAAPQAYFAGKIQIAGDANFAMQLAMSLMARQPA
ncbi:MAG: hypothetical protein D6689_14710 [Deltaproteobacteria bacterium]|nr:MAG: hypothetical protein D6689_14710 [Deltaproteobacteria bacterium]